MAIIRLVKENIDLFNCNDYHYSIPGWGMENLLLDVNCKKIYYIYKKYLNNRGSVFKW